MKFNKTLEAVNIMVMASYPAARFYEAQGILIEENNSFIPEVSGMVIVYSLPLGKTLLVNVTAESEEAYEFKLINENWLEDRSITPYVGMTLEDAFQELVKAEKIIKSRNVVLRHPLHPSYTRPVYIFGDVRRGGNSVDVMTGEIREE